MSQKEQKKLLHPAFTNLCGKNPFILPNVHID